MKLTKALLTCGIVATPLFLALVVIQEATRAGFNPRKHPLSLLSLDDLGWLQITNFVVCGVLAVAGAVGVRRALSSGRASTWGPILFGVYGVGLIWGGVFLADPAVGYPIGTPEDAPQEVSWHGLLHAIAPVAIGIALIAATIVFARRHVQQGERGWAWYSIASAVLYVILGFAAFPLQDFRLMLVGGAILWGWVSVETWRILKTA